MKKTYLSLVFFLFGVIHSSRLSAQIITSDVDHFWEAYDKMVTTSDSATQYQYLQTLFLDKATPGLQAMMRVRNYDAGQYIEFIQTYPLFWQSVRSNMANIKGLSGDIQSGLNRFKSLYPRARNAVIYFTVGVLRSNGTTLDSMVLIGSELALADSNTNTDGFPAYLSHLPAYFKTNPAQNLVFLNVHEFVHTQQKTTIGNNLISQCMIEGVAEFMAVQSLQVPSPNTCIHYGLKNDSLVKHYFTREMFSPYFYHWLWNQPASPFYVRDLGYYIGYAIASAYYQRATDKTLAVQQMIELDYTNQKDLVRFINQSGYFEKPIQQYRKPFEKSRPVVTGIKEFKNHSRSVDPSIQTLTLHFSQNMDKESGGFEFGPLGEGFVLPVLDLVGWSDDGKSVTVSITMEPQKHYQIEASLYFLSEDGLPCQPYLIDIYTRRN